VTGPDPVIALKGVSRSFPGEPPVEAVRDVSLEIAAGDYVALTGPSGSGKSTFVNLLALLDRPTTGQYCLEGTDTAGLTEKDRAGLRAHRIGVIFQDFHLLPYRDATQNVALGLLYQGKCRRERLTRARGALLRVGLGHRLEARPVTLSGGERQRVAIARALAGDPALLLCDEPTGNLDSVATSSVLDLLDHLHLAGLTLFVITHDAQVAARADRQLVMRDGRIEAA
jgi:putative ABC transport system ATP-binding protein